jgi:hypothetical protein
MESRTVMSRDMPLSISGAEGILPAMIMAGLFMGLLAAGCARLPYTTTIVHEDQLVAVVLQREVHPAGYAHPVQMSPLQLSAILRGLSLREEQRLPLRWFAEETPPKKVFREDEIQVLAPRVADALLKAGRDERVYFEVFAPGMNPKYRRDVTGGWLAVRDGLLHITMDYFHAQQPVRKSDVYDYNYPTPWTPPKTYILYFEPGRFFLTDPQTQARGVDIKEFLKTVVSP